MRKPRIITASVALLAAIVPGIVQAQAPAPSSTTAATDQVEVLLREGNELARQWRLQEAEAKYQAAAELDRSYMTIGNVGLMQGEQGKWRDAAQHLWLAMNLFPPEG